MALGIGNNFGRLQKAVKKFRRVFNRPTLTGQEEEVWNKQNIVWEAYSDYWNGEQTFSTIGVNWENFSERWNSDQYFETREVKWNLDENNWNEI